MMVAKLNQPRKTKLISAHLRGPDLGAIKWPTLVAALKSAAEELPDALYVNFIDTRNQANQRSYASIYAGAERIAYHLLARNVSPGDRVVILLPTGEDFAHSLFGAQLVGAVPVPLPLPLVFGDVDAYVESLRAIIADADADYLICGERTMTPASNLMADLGRPRGILPIEEFAQPAAPQTLPTIADDTVALLQYTSGPFSTPHGIALEHRHIMANVQGVGEALELGPDDVGMSWLPMVHDMGLIGVLFCSLYWRYPAHVMPPESFLMHPYRWLQNISAYRATISAAPNFAYGLCTRRVRDKHMADLDLSAWRIALNGAEMVIPDTLNAFAERFAAAGFQKNRFVPIYGLAENALAATSALLETPVRVDQVVDPDNLHDGTVRDVVSVGYALPGQEVAIRNIANGEILSEHEIGEIVVRGACVMPGYFRDETTSRRILREGWLHTGDLGFITDGELYICGRHKEMVIKMGRNYYPNDIEAAACAADGVTVHDALAFAMQNEPQGTEDLVVLVEAEAGDEAAVKLVQAEVNKSLLARIGLRADQIIIQPPHSFPHKDDRRRARVVMKRRHLLGQF